MLDARQLDAISRHLEARAADLREQIRGKLGEAADSVLATDHQWSDAGAAFAEAGVEYAEARRDLLELRGIEQVMLRMAEGNYGVCADCGMHIPAARLLAQPAALTCVTCQATRERRGQVAISA